MTMTKSQATKIAHAVMEIRDDWDFPGIMSVLAKATPELKYGTVLVMMATAAMDPAALTPMAGLANPVYRPDWGRATPTDHAPSAGRDNVIRLRAEQARLDAVKATPERRAAILAEWRKEHAT